MRRGRGPRSRRVRFILIALAVLLVLIAPSALLGFYTEVLWFREIGRSAVLWKMVGIQWGAGLLVGAVSFVMLAGNALIARRLSRPQPIVIEGLPPWMAAADALEKYILPFLTWIILGVALFFGYLTGLVAASHWDDILRFLYRQPFGQTDPVFGRDLGFYVFSLPVLHYVVSWLYWILVFSLAAAVAVHYLARAINTMRGWPRMAPQVTAHLSGLLALLFLVKAAGFRLNAFSLLTTDRPGQVVVGAGYTDVAVRLPVLNILAILCIVAAVLVLVNVAVRNAGIPLLAAGSVIIVYFVGLGLLPPLVERFKVAPNQLSLERQYLDSNVKLTNLGYGLDRVREEKYPRVESPTAATLARYDTTLRNIRLWDYRPLLQTYRNLQVLRQYYFFNDVDVDRYRVGGAYRQVMLAAREIHHESLGQQTWQNLHVSYTHGYGVAMSPVDEFDSEGFPRMFISDIPPVPVVPELAITRPEIYFGEVITNYSLVRLNLKTAPEFDYPITGDVNKTTEYAGGAGIPMTSFLTKLAMSVRFGDVNLLITGLYTPESRILIKRTLRERIGSVAPYLALDDDPYIVLDGSGALYWIQDAYTTTEQFPYSEPEMFQQQRLRYVRNSVKVVVSAYDGSMRFYIADGGDPIIKAYAAAFPGLYQPMAEMPADLRAHVRYPEGLFDLQARLFTVYHMHDPQEFYQKEDRWMLGHELPSKSPTGNEEMEPYFAILQLREEPAPEFVLLIPFTPAQRPNMNAWMAARCDPAHYGELVVYEFPKGEFVQGPMQIENRVDQDTFISERMTLWGRGGSEVLRGNLLIIPMGDGVLYVEPLFISARTEGGAIGQGLPQLKRVIVANQDRLAMAETLQDALAQLVGRASIAAREPTGATAPAVTGDAAFREQVRAAYERAMARKRVGDLAGFEREWDALGRLLGSEPQQ